MEICIIVAAAENNIIGANNDLIWHLPADLKHFKKITSGYPIIMGRKTYDSIGRPLPNRTNIVISRNSTLKIEGVIVVSSMEEALKLVDSDKCFIIGGGKIYADYLDMANTVYLTRIHQSFEGDTSFPVLSPEKWTMVENEKGTLDEVNKIPHSFQVFRKIN